MNIKNISKHVYFYIIPMIVLIFNILIILVPRLVISSARNGLLLWFNNVLPALLPFIIGTNLLIKLGFIDFLGTILENLMQKTFKISGIGAFPLVLGMFSGYPVGAKIVCDLRMNKKISKEEGEKLLTFTNNSGPLFILGTVGVGMFNSDKLGYLMLFVHYTSALTTGLIFRNYKNKKNIPNEIKKVSIKTALKNLKTSRLKENKSFGEILGESVKNALEITVTVGGFIMFFSVISALFAESNIFNNLGEILFPDSISYLSDGIFMGIIEITNGCNILSKSKTALAAVLSISLISWSGFSIHAQTFSIVSKTDLNTNIYILSKIIHSIITLGYSLLLFPVIDKFLNLDISTFNSNINSLNICSIFINSVNLFLTIVISITVVAICITVVNKFIKKN